MGRIRVLSDSLIDRIAAGEVVERPASVVKELLENSLDAGATSVDIRLERGGRERIAVTDDGCGMDAGDARLAVERHATSKLQNPEDLTAIATLGFRGEALSSIAAVSMYRLRTAAADGEGTELRAEGGRVVSVERVGLPRGTSTEVDRLFFNVPARRKFLRSESTELAHAVRWVARYALVHPGLRVRMQHGERRLLDLVPAGDRRERIAQIHGRHLAVGLLSFAAREGGVSVSGFTGRPADGFPRRDLQYFFVNGRAVQDRTLAHAVGSAYENTMPTGRHPACFLFLEIDPTAVDVNVHPQKTEVRFREGSRIHDLVRRAVAGSLSQTAAIPSLSDLRPSEARPELERQTMHGSWGACEPEARFGREGTEVGGRLAEHRRPTSPESDLAGPTATHGNGCVPLAQIRESYIVAEDPQGLVLIDQHAAHERVLFERYLDQAERDRVEVQELLFPPTIELGPEDLVWVEAESSELRRLGFRVEPFGAQTVRLETVPAVAAGEDPESLFREVLGMADRARSVATDVAELRRRLVTTAACHAAIKIHHPLGREAMQALVNDLYATRNPATCPHGRPVLFRMSVEEIERVFRRR